jgi:glutamine phosphoribosylpyrophosphate amidotransferase
MHATGISYVKHGKIITEKRPVPADEFPFNFPSYVNEDGSLYLIGHCRYSTSDLEFNQPIANENLSVVHNGVITQELPEKWKELYGYDCETKNDTELILHTAEDCISPLIRWKDSSLAVIELHVDKVIRFYRNGKRPLYLTSISNGCIITSTADVPKRAEVPGFPINTLMNHYITFDDQLAMTIEKEVIEDAVDLQYELC